jgi:hypothetical protein
MTKEECKKWIDDVIKRNDMKPHKDKKNDDDIKRVFLQKEYKAL